jgi:hypothetical protein
LREIIAEATGKQPQQATNRPGDAAMHEETGIDYETCPVMCNMD